jgi:uncharacterized repeat protein (TIGR02543 family)
MGIILGWRIHHYVARVAILLIMVALLMGMGACGGHDTYQLIISSTAGGSVTVPGEGTFTYDSGTVVELLAIADDGYRFQGWTGDTQDITNLSSPTTNITMSEDYSITANFGPMGPHGPGIP